MSSLEFSNIYFSYIESFACHCSCLLYINKFGQWQKNMPVQTLYWHCFLHLTDLAINSRLCQCKTLYHSLHLNATLTYAILDKPPILTVISAVC